MLKAKSFCTNRTIGMTSFSISTNHTIGTNGPSKLTNRTRLCILDLSDGFFRVLQLSPHSKQTFEDSIH